MHNLPVSLCHILSGVFVFVRDSWNRRTSSWIVVLHRDPPGIQLIVPIISYERKQRLPRKCGIMCRKLDRQSGSIRWSGSGNIYLINVSSLWDVVCIFDFGIFWTNRETQINLNIIFNESNPSVRRRDALQQ